MSRKVSKIGVANLQNNIDRMFGSGRSTEHQTMGPIKTGSAPAGHVVTVSQMEYVTDVVGSTFGINVVDYDINPANPALFPQLSQMAALYTEYCFEELVFEYRPLVFDQIASSNNDMGYIAMAINYDAEFAQLGNLFINKKQFDQLEDVVNNKPSEPLICHANVGKRRSGQNDLATFYVRAPGTNQGLDIRLSDLGTLNIATGQQQDSFILGELFVKYRVCFYKQKISPGVGAVVTSGRWLFENATTSNYFTNQITTSGPLSGLVTFSGNKITLPRDFYKSTFMMILVFSSESGVGSVAVPAITDSVNITAANLWYSPTTGAPVAGYASSSTLQIIGSGQAQTGLVVTGYVSGDNQLVSPSFTLSGATLPPGVVVTEVVLTTLDSSITF